MKIPQWWYEGIQESAALSSTYTRSFLVAGKWIMWNLKIVNLCLASAYTIGQLAGMAGIALHATALKPFSSCFLLAIFPTSHYNHVLYTTPEDTDTWSSL